MSERRPPYRTGGEGRRRQAPVGAPAGANPALAAIYAQVSEEALLRWVVGLARTYGLLCYHTHWAIKSQAGYPDMCLVPDPARWSVDDLRALMQRGVPVIRWWELKSQRGMLSDAQQHWQAALQAIQELAPDLVEYRVVRPSDKAEIEAALARMLPAAQEGPPR